MIQGWSRTLRFIPTTYPYYHDEQQAAWIGCYTIWCATYKHMLVEKTVLVNGRIVNTYERLVRACNMLNARLCAGDLFTYLNLEVTK